jgi:hypothetical protein
MLRATVPERAALASLPVLATAPVSGDIVGAVLAGTEGSLAARIAVIVTTTVALGRTTVAESTSFANLAVDASATAIGGDLAGFAVASAELGLTTSVAVLCLDAAPAACGTTVSKCAALAGFAIEAAAATIGRDGTGTCIAGAERSLTSCTATVVLSAVTLCRAAISECASPTGLAVVTTTTIGRDTGFVSAVSESGLAAGSTEVITLATVAIGRTAVSV